MSSFLFLFLFFFFFFSCSVHLCDLHSFPTRRSSDLWYSTLYSWYVFGSSFVAGMAVILLFVVYLKNQGNLRLVNKEHIHDLGKFLFAFSIFWTYLWFSQFMLIWYSNICDETQYCILRAQGPSAVIF